MRARAATQPDLRGRLALPIVRPFAARAATIASADFSLRWPCGPRRSFRRKARPPRVSASAFAARPPDIRRLSLGHESFAVIGPLAPARLSLVSGSCSSARSFAPRFLHASLAARRSAVRFARCDQLTRGLPPPNQCPCRAHQRKEAPARGTGASLYAGSRQRKPAAFDLSGKHLPRFVAGRTTRWWVLAKN
jgi:hypothetical protein